MAIESSRGSGRDLLKGITHYGNLHSPWSFCWFPGGLDEVLLRLQDIQADGIIMRDSKRTNEILKLNIPLIVVHHSLSENNKLINIITNAEEISSMAAKHLLECGLQHFAYCGIDTFTWSKARSDFFCREIQKSGFEVHVYDSPKSKDRLSMQRELKNIVEWLQRLPKPVGIMACNDDRSQHVVQACKQADIQIPNEAAIIGVDNDELVCELSNPKLSSIAVNFERAGFEAASVLDQLMKGEKVEKKNVIVPATHIAARISTDASFHRNQEVACALSYIRNNAQQIIGVDDVVQSVPSSRRTLENKFRKILNRSILDEIRRVRVNQICRMLVESNMTVLDIALSLGFTGSEHISRYFRKEKKISLLQYRKQYGKK